MAAPAATLEQVLAELQALRKDVARLRKDVTRAVYGPDGSSRGRRRVSWSQRARQPKRCGACAHTEALHWHHIVPISEDGEDTFSNVIALCPNCHAAAHAGRLSRADLTILREEQVQAAVAEEAAAIGRLAL